MQLFWRRQLCACVLIIGAFTGGCNRGGHPEQLGEQAPEFALNDGQHAVDLQSLRGQVVVLNFWATWCAPCLVEMPSLETLQQTLPQVKVVAVAFDEDSQSYQAWLQRHPLSLFTVLDERQVANTRFRTFRPPETYVIDKAGVIRRKFIGPQDWTSPEIIDSLRKLAG